MAHKQTLKHRNVVLHLLPNDGAETIVPGHRVPCHSCRSQSIGIVAEQGGMLIEESFDHSMRVIGRKRIERGAVQANARWTGKITAGDREESRRSHLRVPGQPET